MADTPFAGARIQGPWAPDGIVTFLRDTVIPLRLAAVGPSGWPLVLSLWFLLEGDELVCATQRGAGVARALELDPRCAFEVAGEQPPYRGVRGRGRVRLETEGAGQVLAALIERYLGSQRGSLARWLLSRAETEIAIRIEPTTLSSWDYTRRMSET